MCDDLWTQGFAYHALTLEALTERLLTLGYKKGSPNQTFRYRTSWKESRGIVEPTPSSATALTGQDPISRAVNLVREELQVEADKTIAQIQEDALDQIEVSKRQYETAKVELEQYYQELIHVREERQALQEQHAALQTQFADTQQQLTLSHQQIQTQEKHRVELKVQSDHAMQLLQQSYQESLQQLDIQIKNQEQNYQATMSYHKEITEQQRQQFMVERDQLLTVNKQLTTEVTKAQILEQTARTEINRLEEQLAVRDTEIAQFFIEKAAFKSELSEQEKNSSAIQARYELVCQQLTEKEELLRASQELALSKQLMIGRMEEQLKQFHKLLQKNRPKS